MNSLSRRNPKAQTPQVQVWQARFLELIKSLTSAFLFAGIITWSEHHNTAEAQEAKERKDIPTLSVPWLLDLASQNSDTISLLKNGSTNLASQSLRLGAQYEPQFKSSLSHSTSRLERPGQGFDPGNATDTDSTMNSALVSLSKKFRYGTSISKTIQGTVHTEERSQPAGQGPEQTQEAQWTEFKTDLAVRQSLWKNSFGKSDRLREKSADSTSKGTALHLKQSVEDYFELLTAQYFQTWLAFSNVKTAQERLAREKHRHTLYSAQFKKGFVEKSSMLQLDSSVIASENQLLSSRESAELALIALSDIVKQDLLSLYQSAPEFFQFEREATTDVEQLCSGSSHSQESLGGSQELSVTHAGKNHPSYEVDSALKRVESSQFQLQAIESDSQPDLYVEGKVSQNAIEESLFETGRESIKNENPHFSVSVGIQVSLGDGVEEADRMDAIFSKKKASLEAAQAQSQLNQAWKETCHSFFATSEKLAFTNKRIEIEKQRVKLIDREFAIGKSDLNTLISAEDILTGVSSERNALLAQLSIDGWKIRRMNGDLRDLVERTMKSPAPNQRGDK